MWIYNSPPKILFFKEHIQNLLNSIKKYKIYKPSIKKDINKLIKKNIDLNKNYNHLLRVALNKKIISISLRKRVKPKLDFNLKLVKLKREKPEFKNLKYKEILKYLSKMESNKGRRSIIILIWVSIFFVNVADKTTSCPIADWT